MRKLVQKLIGQRYKIEKLIGSGGMASVYQAFDTKLSRHVAVKILHDHMAKIPEIRKRFQVEAQAISSLNHPSIVKIYDYSGLTSSDAWLVTEMITGWNLGQFLNAMPLGRLHPLIAAFIIREICKALAIVHAQGIIHRDIKPENVMLTSSGIIKLMDFGIAKDIHQNALTMTGTFMGSPSYMSVEQIKGKGVDARSDLYSLCVLFYEIVTGKLPFTGNTSHDVVLKIVGGKFLAPRQIITYLPEIFDTIIIKGMQNNRDRRFENADEMINIIDKFLFSQGFVEAHVELERFFISPETYEEKLKNKVCHEYFLESKNLLNKSSKQDQRIASTSVKKFGEVLKPRRPTATTPAMSTTVFAYENSSQTPKSATHFSAAQPILNYKNDAFYTNGLKNDGETKKSSEDLANNSRTESNNENKVRPNPSRKNQAASPPPPFRSTHKKRKYILPTWQQKAYLKSATKRSSHKTFYFVVISSIVFYFFYNLYSGDLPKQSTDTHNVLSEIVQKMQSGRKPSVSDSDVINPAVKTKNIEAPPKEVLSSGVPENKKSAQEVIITPALSTIEIVSDSIPLRILLVDQTTGSMHEFIQMQKLEQYEVSEGVYEVKLLFGAQIKKTKIFNVTENSPRKRISATFKKQD